MACEQNIQLSNWLATVTNYPSFHPFFYPSGWMEWDDNNFYIYNLECRDEKIEPLVWWGGQVDFHLDNQFVWDPMKLGVTIPMTIPMAIRMPMPASFCSFGSCMQSSEDFTRWYSDEKEKALLEFPIQVHYLYIVQVAINLKWSHSLSVGL